jgi:hypothetical protein
MANEQCGAQVASTETSTNNLTARWKMGRPMK